MSNKTENNSGYEEGENHRIGRELYDRDRQDNRYKGNREPSGREWGEGNFFHTGPSRHGAQDNPSRNQYFNRSGNTRSSYNQGQQPSNPREHYGNKPDSTYRNERNYLDHGDSYNPRYGNAGGTAAGSYNQYEPYREHNWQKSQDDRSLYKQDDYRYGSGSHNWYSEGRYTPDESRRQPADDRGFFERVGSTLKNTWNDIMHSDDPDYPRNYRDTRNQSDRVSSHERHGSEQFMGRRFDNGYDRDRDMGYEGGPRWADETDSGKDNYYNDTDRSQRNSRR